PSAQGPKRAAPSADFTPDFVPVENRLVPVGSPAPSPAADSDNSTPAETTKLAPAESPTDPDEAPKLRVVPTKSSASKAAK
ncbi:MAG TPA: hypothetical protein VJL29_10175, partial [Thermoguttaceae bacterium]|nr:hypothetical protein [Thermoguttaceae bacterium]